MRLHPIRPRQGNDAGSHSVALSAGIPRETARRKIAALVEKGWVACDAAGNLSATARAAEALAEGTGATVKYIRAVKPAERTRT